MTAGMRTFAAARCRRRSRPLIPVIRRSSTRQPVFSRWADVKNFSAEANVSTRKPTDRRKFLSERRNDSSSSTTEITGVSCAPMRCRCPSNVGVESIDCQARLSGGTRLPYVGRVELYPTFGGFPHCLQLRQSSVPARPAGRHPELLPDEPPAAAVQDRLRHARYFIVELAESHCRCSTRMSPSLVNRNVPPCRACCVQGALAT